MSASSRKLSVWLLVLLLPAVGYVGWYNYRHFTGADDVETPEAPNPKWRYATEEHWLVDETARDIAEMLSFARDGRIDGLEVTVTPAKGKPRSYDFRAQRPEASVKESFQSKDYIWSPAEYAPWAAKLLSAWKLTPPAAPTSETAILETLTSPTPQKLRQESKRLTEALTRAPLDAGLHEQAALVTAAFALREAAGAYCDSRREISRIAAHLAIAQALQPQGTSPVRKFADAALQTLAGREAPVLALLADLEHDATPGAAAWVRALRMHNGTDWRHVAPNPTLFEELETFYARAKNVGTESAIQWISARKPAAVDDWRRMILEAGVGVESGHQFAKNSVPLEIASLQTDWSMFFGGKLPDNDIVKAMSAAPARSVTQDADGKPALSVLGWDLWSARHQRHFCKAVDATITFLRDDWGVPEYREAQKFVRENFAGLPLFPTIERQLTEDRNETAAISGRVNQLLDNHPEIVPPSVWGHLLLPDNAVPALPVMSPQRWLKPVLPFGTTYDLCTCSGCIHFPSPSDTDWWTASLRIAPANFDLLSTRIWLKYGAHPPADVVEATYAPVQDYNLWALEAMAAAEKGRSPRYAATMQRVCELHPASYIDLGDYYRDAKQPEPAAAAYLQAVELNPDRVQMSNTCGWLVNYLDDHGQAEKALAIATEAAEAYSFRGLETMARLKEKHAQFKDAEDCYKKIAERYEKDGVGPLVAFYLRNEDKDPAFKAAALGFADKVFPRGLTKAVLSDFKDPPRDGALLTSSSSSSLAAGMQQGDVIVALNGYRVQNDGQYTYVRGLSDDPKLQLIVWNPKGYREIAASPPDRMFKVGLATYHRAGK